jgi:hypothetical protein
MTKIVPDEGNFRNMSWALISISTGTFLFLLLEIKECFLIIWLNNNVTIILIKWQTGSCVHSHCIMFMLTCCNCIVLHRSRGSMVVGFTSTCAIGAYYHWSCEFEPCSWRGVLDTTLCDKELRQVSGFFWVLRFPPPIKLTAAI